MRPASFPLFFEKLVEKGQIRKTAGIGYSRYSPVRVFQLQHGLLEPFVKDVPENRLTGIFLEGLAQVRNAVSRTSRRRRDGRGSV